MTILSAPLTIAIARQVYVCSIRSTVLTAILALWISAMLPVDAIMLPRTALMVTCALWILAISQLETVSTLRWTVMIALLALLILAVLDLVFIPQTTLLVLWMKMKKIATQLLVLLRKDVSCIPLRESVRTLDSLLICWLVRASLLLTFKSTTMIPTCLSISKATLE